MADNPEAEGRVKLTKAQRNALTMYEHCAPTKLLFGTMATWRALIRKGCLRKSIGLGIIETDITTLGREALRHGG